MKTSPKSQKNSTKSLIEKKQRTLRKVKKQLKQYFIGIDNIIDQLIDNIESWYIFPEYLTRPIVVNLWGMTGVGKTDLVRKLVEFLDLEENFLEIQLKSSHQSMGEFLLEKAMVESDFGSVNQNILFLDEVTKIRTIDEDGLETQDCAFQDMWSLLSDGRFPASNKDKDSIFSILDDIKRYSKNEELKTVAACFFYDEILLFKRATRCSEMLLDIRKWSLEKMEKYILNFLDTGQIYKQVDYSKTLVIISGNLDKIFAMSDSVEDSDMDADVLYDYTKGVNIIDVKTELKEMFKPEQIARFGNTHLIYTSLSKESYKKIIEKKVNEVINNYNEKSGIEVVVDQSIMEFIYRNGVFPSQGTRPVFTTITSIVENNLPYFVLQCLKSGKKKIRLSYKNGEIIGVIGKKKFKKKCEGSLDVLRKKDNENMRALTAVHEAGHAVVYSVLFGIAPSQISIGTLGQRGGFTGLHNILYSEQSVLNKITTVMAGRASESIVFNGLISGGSRDDIQVATDEAAFMVRALGLGNSLQHIESPFSGCACPGANYSVDETNEEMKDIVEKGYEQAKEIIQDHKKLFDKVIYELYSKKIIEPERFKEIFEKEEKIELEVISSEDTIMDDYVGMLEKYRKI